MSGEENGLSFIVEELAGSQLVDLFRVVNQVFHGREIGDILPVDQFVHERVGERDAESPSHAVIGHGLDRGCEGAHLVREAEEDDRVLPTSRTLGIDCGRLCTEPFEITGERDLWTGIVDRTEDGYHGVSDEVSVFGQEI